MSRMVTKAEYLGQTGWTRKSSASSLLVDPLSSREEDEDCAIIVQKARDAAERRAFLADVIARCSALKEFADAQDLLLRTNVAARQYDALFAVKIEE